MPTPQGGQAAVDLQPENAGIAVARSLPLPGEHPVPEVANRMKCSACGSRKVHTAPELYPGGIEAMRTRWGGQ